nr:uncharacterized mitochondrial protein AtMg00810-like [Ziziphus jujuba var. spinosa]
MYVDDILLTGDDTIEGERMKQVLAKEFEIKDLVPMKYFLGMEVVRSKKGIYVSQRKYIVDLLKETGFLGSKLVDTLIEKNHKLGCKKGKIPVNKGRYQSVVSQFMYEPHEEHLKAIHRILRYLERTPKKGLFFKENDLRKIKAFTDADRAGSANNRRSTTRYCTFIWGNLVTWRSKKQPVVARSSAEAELRAFTQGICELLWCASQDKAQIQHLEIICASAQAEADIEA